MTKINKSFKNEEEASDYVKELAGFYKQVAIYVLSNTLFVLYWLLGGEGYFWPIWVMLGWGTPLFFVAVDLQILPSTFQRIMNSIMESLPIPFLRPGWESKKIQALKKAKTQGKSPVASSSFSAEKKVAKVAAKKPVAPKKPVAKKAPKKAAK